jgi:hypothetical protein
VEPPGILLMRRDSSTRSGSVHIWPGGAGGVR